MDRFLTKLKAQRGTFADQVLQNPPGRDGYSMGYAAGFYQGLIYAEKLLEQILEDEKNERHGK